MTLPLPRPLPPPLPYPSQEKRVKEQSAHLLSKNLEVEEAVRDLVQLVCNYELRTTDKVVCPEALGKVYAHYAQLMYNAVLVCTQQSLLGLKRRVGSRPIAGIVQVDRPFFDVQVELDVPNVAMSPSLYLAASPLHLPCISAGGARRAQRRDEPLARRYSAGHQPLLARRAGMLPAPAAVELRPQHRQRGRGREPLRGRDA